VPPPPPPTHPPTNGARSSPAPCHLSLRRQRSNTQHNPSNPALCFAPSLSPSWPQRARLQRVVVPVFPAVVGEGGGGRRGSCAYGGVLRQPRPQALLQGQGNPEGASLPCFFWE
jgi:hypothetical protein